MSKNIIYKTPDEAVDGVAFSEDSTAVIGTPDDLVKRIREMVDITNFPLQIKNQLF